MGMTKTELISGTFRYLSFLKGTQLHFNTNFAGCMKQLYKEIISNNNNNTYFFSLLRSCCKHYYQLLNWNDKVVGKLVCLQCTSVRHQTTLAFVWRFRPADATTYPDLWLLNAPLCWPPNHLTLSVFGSALGRQCVVGCVRKDAELTLLTKS